MGAYSAFFFFGANHFYFTGVEGVPKKRWLRKRNQQEVDCCLAWDGQRGEAIKTHLKVL